MRNLNNTDIEKLAEHYANENHQETGGVDWSTSYQGFITGFYVALEELQKEYTEVKNVYIGKGELSKEDYSYVGAGRFDILVKRKDLK
jgi:hypothetical protein